MMAPRPVSTVQPQSGGPSAAAGSVAGSAAAGSSMGDSMDEKSYDEEESGEGAGESGEDDTEAKLYNPADFKHLSVSSEIQDLFDYIGRFKPQDIELETKLKPFIPDYIPAVGDIDPFLKVPRPDDKPDTLGLTVLDEPAAHQSDPGVLEQALRVFGKEQIAKPLTVRSIENADKNPKKITSWIQNLEEVHRKKPPPTVNLSKPMPDIFDKLMQIWPADFEQALKETPLPSAEMNMELANYVRVVCALLDIPVYDKLTESLYHLCSLYSAFKSNAHFQQSEPGAE